MSARFVIRKNSGDPDYPWSFRDAACKGSESHDFSGGDSFENCNGNCDAYMSFEAAIEWIDQVPA